ncbi:MAG: hypothetical protein VYA67_13615 [Actinomycetota bacterium]|uniref:hypothetical protein n=1 Tax=Mycobacterium lentiflavum TaxID=141349 RepID=UPI0011122682|nr:hypothetical protein [Mycobacterium lentiflavum]MEE3064974.1 hypothetical protein [Actinomycetota bacterium]
MAAALYGGFRLFYDNWRGKLRQGEIDTMLAQIEARGSGGATDLAVVRTFLEEDDGREFVMVNLVRVPDTTVTDPDTGAEVPANAMMRAYSKAFMPLLLRHGGHPALATRKVGGYIDSWMVGPDPGWSIVGFMRYRSRRDMLKMVLNPAFEAAHKYKPLGVAETFSFPTQPFLRAYVSPRVSVFLILALAAALAQLAIIAIHGGGG